MNTWMRSLTVVLVGGGLIAAAGCSNADATTGPSSPSPLFAKGAGGGGGGGGGTDVPPPPPMTTLPTISMSSTLLAPGADVLVGEQVGVFVVATSESGDRKAPVLTLQAAPAGFTLSTIVSVDSPHGGGPGYTEAQYVWTPTRDQIGLTATVTLAATTSAGTVTSTANFSPVLDAPSALTGLAASIVGDHIEAHWDASVNGVAPISYVVRACYQNANIRPVFSTCDVITTTTANQALAIPRVNPSPTVAPAGGVATYDILMVTPVDAAGHAGTPASVTVL